MATPTSSLTWLEIDKAAFFHNILQYKTAIGNGCLAAVIKSNAYGHGQELIAQLCQENQHVDWLCVANLSEAIQLRKQGITKPILILSYIDADLVYAAQYDIDFICYEKDLLEQANATGALVGKKLKIHIKVDTGVSRFGLMPEDVLPFITYAQTLPHIHMNGIFTHFAQAQQEDQTFTQKQLRAFLDLLESLQTQSIHIPFRHCANSAATTTIQAGPCNLFRVGAGLYGMWPSEIVKQRTIAQFSDFSLKQVLTWKTTILDVRTIPAHTPVGYDGTFVTTRVTNIALAPVGYYEGYDRRLSNTGQVIIKNMPAPVIGRICMNILMIDVTDIPHVHKGDIAILLGDYPGLTPNDIAQRAKSFNPREIASRLHTTIPRIVVSNDAQLTISSTIEPKTMSLSI